MTMTEIIQQLRDTQNRSDSPNDYEVALTSAFDFLGFQAKTIGGKGDTDVLLTANIGRESYKVDVDGKTSKTEKISDAQIDWLSLKDHKAKNKSNFVVVAGPGFAGGNLEKRANEHGVCLLTTDELIKLLEAHSKYPFTLLEMKDLFAEAGYLTEQVNDLLSQNQTRRHFLEKFKIILEEMETLQNSRLGYFTYESLASREKILQLEIENEDIESIIQLLKIPFINAIYQIDQNKFVFTLNKKDLANTFFQISQIISDKKFFATTPTNETIEIPLPDTTEKTIATDEPEIGTKYYEWQKEGNSIIAYARQEQSYKHYCPIEHFKTILSKITIAFQNQNVINNDTIYQLLENQELSTNRQFKGKAEEYKIRMTIGILELQGLLKWTGSKRPIEYTLNKPIEELNKWITSSLQ